MQQRAYSFARQCIYDAWCLHWIGQPEETVSVCVCGVQGARHIVASEGMRGLYQGLVPTLLRDVPEIAIQFALYEK